MLTEVGIERKLTSLATSVHHTCRDSTFPLPCPCGELEDESHLLFKRGNLYRKFQSLFIAFIARIYCVFKSMKITGYIF